MPALPDPLTFRCTGCGNCCRALRAAITVADVARLAAASGRAASELVAWLPPDEVDMAGEPESFVELSAGRRLMVLAQARGACVLLTPDDRCSAYAARPLDCRTFPFDFERAASTSVQDGNVRLTLLPLLTPEREAGALLSCDYASDGEQNARELAELDAWRFRELAAYQQVVARWNRLARHRRRLRHPLGSGADFLHFALS